MANGIDSITRNASRSERNIAAIMRNKTNTAINRLVAEPGALQTQSAVIDACDRLAFLKGFDVFVLPSRSEGIPRGMMESMAAEVPIIATDIPGCRNLIDGVNTGLLFPVDDSEALGDRIKKLSHAEDLRKAISQNGKAFLKEYFSASRMAREYEKLYCKLIPQDVAGHNIRRSR